MRDRSVTCHPHVYPHGISHPAFISQPQTISPLISRPAEGRWLSWPGWLGEILRWFARPKTVTHPSISRGWESNSQPSFRKFTRLLSDQQCGWAVTPSTEWPVTTISTCVTKTWWMLTETASVTRPSLLCWNVSRCRLATWWVTEPRTRKPVRFRSTRPTNTRWTQWNIDQREPAINRSVVEWRHPRLTLRLG